MRTQYESAFSTLEYRNTLEMAAFKSQAQLELDNLKMAHSKELFLAETSHTAALAQAQHAAVTSAVLPRSIACTTVSTMTDFASADIPYRSAADALAERNAPMTALSVDTSRICMHGFN